MIARPDNTKEFNRKLVLAEIRSNEFVSRSEIVNNTGLSKAAVSSLVTEMLEQGLVEEIGSQSTVKGRPRITLALLPQTWLALGAELTDHECRVVLTDLRATPLKEVAYPLTTTDLTVDNLLDFLQKCVAEVLVGVDEQKIIGMGLTIPAVVNPSTSTVLLSVLLPWRDINLSEELSRRFAFPVALVSRGNAATWGERLYGAGQKVPNLLYVRVGNGIVAGLVINGQPYLGQGFGAGELGHVTVQPDGAICRCGNQGCLATVATTESLLMRVRRILREYPADPLWQVLSNHHLEDLTLADVFRATADGNSVVQQALDEIAVWLAIALASAVNLLNLDRIIVGGPMMMVGEALLKPLRTHLQQRALPTHLARIDVVASALKETAPSIGAASLILHEALAPNPTPLLSAAFSERITLFG